MVSDDQLDQLHGAMSDEQLCALARLRGRCSCSISQLCGACMEPLTEDEANQLGLLPDEPASPDYMAAVRSMSKGGL